MNKQELLLNILSKKNTRISYLEKDFYNFFIYYFQKHIKYPKLAPFHKDWCKTAQDWLNMYVEWHRESAKTTILWMAYEIWCICYQKRNFICNLCYDKDKAKSFNKLIAQELIHNVLLLQDFWVLYSKKSSAYNEEDLSEKWISEFVTTNYIKVKAFWMWEAIRWEVFNSKTKWNVRPSLIFCQPKWNIVLTSLWEKDISEIKIWDLVFTHKSNYKEVINILTTNELNIYKIKIHWYNEYFSFSEWHRVLSKHTKSKYNVHFKNYDDITPEFTEVEKLKKWTYIWFPINKKENRYIWKINTKVFDSVKINKKNWQFISWPVYLNKIKDIELDKRDYYILWHFVWNWSLKKNWIVIHCDKTKDYQIKSIEQNSNYWICYSDAPWVKKLHLSSVKLERICKQIKKPKNSWKIMPTEFETDLIENQIEFIKWYIDSDWYIDTKNNCIRITSVCLPLLRQVQRILLRLWITSSIRDWIDWNNNSIICWCKCKTQKKYDLYMRQWIEILWYWLKSQTRYKYNHLKQHIYNWFLWCSIKDIKKQDKKEVCYTFKVNDDKSYCNHLITNHNCDDIDNNKNTKNINIIKADMDFLNWEVIGWLDKNYGQIIWLWNIIRKDWRNPRKREEIRNNPNWKLYSNFIYWEAGNTTWPIQWERYVETEKESINNKISLDSIRREEWSSFNQNWLWIPLIKWQSVIKEEWIRYTREDIKFDYIQIWVDPAFSLKTWSDAIWIAVTGFKKINETIYKYGIYCKKLEWTQKDEDIAEKIIESLYNKYWVARILVEKNNWWEIFWRLLQKKWLSVEIVNATKDKLSRFKEHEWDLMRWQIFFYPECSELVNEMLDFTWDDWWQDNLVDAFVHSLQEYNQKEFYFSIS